MNLKSLLFLLLLSPAISFCQSVDFPSVRSAEDPSTIITKIEVNNEFTVITFKHITAHKGGWMQLNKSMYLQDGSGEDRYNYVKSEGIPLRPERHYAAADNEEMVFTVYFEKLKPGTKSINVIERARAANDRAGAIFDNFYNVSLEKQTTPAPHMITRTPHVKIITDTVMMPVPPFDFQAGMSSIAPMVSQMYDHMMDAQLKFYSNPATIKQLAKINKDYYNALIKIGFSPHQAFKIVISKPLISTEMAGKQ
jgi:hypothetical protein